jgi:PPOX class probable F420-dependent enzyme
MTSALETLGTGKYLSLTTFREDGTPVATPVWLVRDGDALRVLTGPTSGKVKRLRSNPSVLVAPCDMRGRVKAGVVPVPATVTLEDEAQTEETRVLVTKRYGLMGRILGWSNERRARKANGGVVDHQGLRIRLDG